MMIKVGKFNFWKPNSKGKNIAVDYAYTDVEYDEDGWADASNFLPADFDLVYLKIEGKRTVAGWSIGKGWDGLRFNQNDKVLYWKKKPDETNECKADLQ